MQLTLRYRGEDIFCEHDEPIPPIGSFVRHVDGEKEVLYKVQQLEFCYGFGERCKLTTSVTVHLRGLHPGEAGNMLEPTGYLYEGDNASEV